MSSATRPWPGADGLGPGVAGGPVRAAYRAGRVAELDWACRAAAFTEAVRGGLGPPLTCSSTPSWSPSASPAPRTCARPSEAGPGNACGSRRPTSSTPSGPRPSGPTPWSSPRASRPSSTPARPWPPAPPARGSCSATRRRCRRPCRPRGAILRNAPPTGNPATPWEVVASAREPRRATKDLLVEMCMQLEHQGLDPAEPNLPGLLPGGRPVHPGHPEPVRVPGHPGGVHRRPRPRHAGHPGGRGPRRRPGRRRPAARRVGPDRDRSPLRGRAGRQRPRRPRRRGHPAPLRRGRHPRPRAGHPGRRAAAAAPGPPH